MRVPPFQEVDCGTKLEPEPYTGDGRIALHSLPQKIGGAEDRSSSRTGFAHKGHGFQSKDEVLQ